MMAGHGHIDGLAGIETAFALDAVDQPFDLVIDLIDLAMDLETF